MGTHFTITLYAADQQQAEAAFQAAFTRIRQLDDCLSNYKSDSEVNRLSASSPHASAVQVSHHVWQVLQRAEQYSRLSEGAFDVTIGPVTKLWRRARRTHKLPTEDRLRQARDAVGFDFLELQAEPKTVQMTRPGMLLDLGGIAKGYALDVALQTLRERGLNRALLDGGGDLLAGQPPPGRTGWTIAMADVEGRTDESSLMQLVREAVATSGDVFQFVEIDGVRYSHLVDPRTGLGLTQRSSVTVVTSDATAADALASAVSVLGTERGLRLIESLPNTDVRIIVIQDDQLRALQTSGFPVLDSAK
jgi:thiamine biosynthesis lipoprotein